MDHSSVSYLLSIITIIMFKDVQQQQQQQQQKISFNSSSYSPKKVNDHWNKSPVEYEQIRIIGTTQ